MCFEGVAILNKLDQEGLDEKKNETSIGLREIRKVHEDCIIFLLLFTCCGLNAICLFEFMQKFKPQCRVLMA